MNLINNILLLKVFSLVSFKVESAKLVWKNHITIDSDMLDSNLEQISSDMISSLNLAVDDSKFERLHNLVDSLPHSNQDYNHLKLEDYDYETDYGDALGSNNGQSRKRLAEGKLNTSTLKTFINGSYQEFDYNLEQFKQEYDSVPLEIPDIPTPPNPGNFSLIKSDDDRPFVMNEVFEYSNDCMSMASWKYLIYGYACIWHELRNIGSPAVKISNILIISLILVAYWLVIYAAIATAFWCYNGTCCCCIKSDILHPYEGMKKIKKKAHELPPGVTILPNGKTKLHTPTASELKAYNKLLKSFYS